MMFPTSKLKFFLTISNNFSSSNLPVPKVSTHKDTGCALPIAYATSTSQRRAKPFATMFFAT